MAGERKTDIEIGPGTKVRLGVVCIVGTVVLGFAGWLNSVHSTLRQTADDVKELREALKQVREHDVRLAVLESEIRKGRP